MAEKVKAQELFNIFTDLMNGGNPHTQTLFKDPFPRRYLTYRPAPGKEPIILERMPDGVVVETALKVVAAEILKYTRELDPADGDHLVNYMFDEGKALRCATYWMMAQEPILPETIAAVRFKSEVGLTWHRCDFDPQEMETPLFDSLCDHMLHNRFACQAFIGALFDPTADRQFYLWLQGEGGDGKGTLMRLLADIFGPAYTVMSSDLKNNQFTNSRLVGKRIGMFQDCRNRNYVMSENFMQLSGGDNVFIESKGKDGYSASINTFFIFSSNLLPNITKSRAHQRRPVIVNFKERTEDSGDPRTFKERFYAERAGIVWKCMKAWEQMLNQHGKMVADRSIAELVADDYEDKHLSTFDRYFVHKPESELGIRCSEAYDILRDRARLNDFEIHDFKDYLTRKGIHVFRPRNGNRDRLYKGLFAREARYEPERAF